MKTLEELKLIKQNFSKEYRAAFTALGNNLSIGLGQDEKTGEYTIVANLTNKFGKSLLPLSYKGIKVDIRVIGDIIAQ